MAFKMNKPSITQGTAGHRSATESHLKMSALKAKEDKESSEMTLDYSYNPDSKAISYSDAYMNIPYQDHVDADGYFNREDEYGRVYDFFGRKGDNRRDGKKDFETAAKAWNMKTYGTHNPTADAKKGGMTKAELAEAHKAKASNSSSTSTKTEPVKDTSTIKTKGGTITNTEKPGGGTKVTIKSDSKPLNSSDEKGKKVNKDRPMTREEETAQRKRREDKEAAATAAPKAPKSESKLGQTIITRGKSHTGATTKTIDRGGKVRRVVSKDPQGNKSVIKYDRKGNVKKTGKQRRAEKATKKDAELAEKKTTYATKKAEMNAKNARVRAEKIAKNNAEGDKKKANMNKAVDALEKEIATTPMKNMKDGKYNHSFAKKKSKY